MNLRTLLPIALLLAVGVGCKSGDSTAPSADNTATNSKPAADDSAKAGTADSSGNTVVGSWTNDQADMKDAVITFGEDGSVEAKGGIPIGGKTADADMKATYKMDGDKMTMHFTSMELTAPADADAKMKKEVDDTNKAAQTMKQPDETDTVAWKDKDTFTATDPKGKVTTFKRKS